MVVCAEHLCSGQLKELNSFHHGCVGYHYSIRGCAYMPSHYVFRCDRETYSGGSIRGAITILYVLFCFYLLY